jgi:Cu(I)/Ag(I) efflux system protein CusF
MEGIPIGHKGMNMPMDQKATLKTVKATDVVKKVNAEKGTVMIAHEPVEALGWPSMAMGFKNEATPLEGLKQGEGQATDLIENSWEAAIDHLQGSVLYKVCWNRAV